MSTGKEAPASGEKNKVLVAGQTPPPYHGQAIMIGEMLKGNFKTVELYSVRLRFSREPGEIGRFRVRKIFHLIPVITRIIVVKMKHKIDILYYPPAGPDVLPVIRDLIVLSIVRRFFKKTVFHFHACGVSTVYEKLPRILKMAYRKSYFFPDAAIRPSAYSPEDGRFLRAKTEFTVPNGIPDRAGSFDPVRGLSPVCRLLYVGRVIESKGIKILLEACGNLLSKGMDFRLAVVGPFESRRFKDEIVKEANGFGLKGRIEFCGVLIGEEKFKQYGKADVFCYPTFYGAETFGIALLEAMQFSLPVVASQWRGVSAVVRDGRSGFLVPAGDNQILAGKLEQLIKDPGLRMRMGREARSIYLEEYTFDRFLERMEHVFLKVAEGEN